MAFGGVNMDLEGGVTGEKGGDKGHKGIIFRNNADMVLFLAVRFRSRGSYRIFLGAGGPLPVLWQSQAG